MKLQQYVVKLTKAAVTGFIAIFGLTSCNSTIIHSTPPLSEEMHAPVVAVTSFENRAGFEGQWKLGDGMADLLVSELVLSRNFVVVERQHFEKIAGEIQRQQSSLFRSEGKTPIGRMKNAQYLIRGVITDFSQTGSSSFFLSTLRSLFLMGRSHTARVSLTLTLVDVETGQILSSVQSTGLVRTREAFIESSYKGVSFGGEVFFATPLGKATARAIEGGVNQIVRDMPQNPWRPMISCIREGTILVNGGKDRGFREGAEYIVRGPAEPVTDPATGDVLTFVPGARIGLLCILQVDEKVSFAKVIQGQGFNRGQWLAKATPTTRGP
ncbi:MAG: CsgG/HfaB family protein [bacterium]|jgi:curli biogenesis system outer membrane secretion channel CsgG